MRDQHGRDESWAVPSPPDAVVFPHSTEEVVEVVKICAAHGLPIIPYGAGTSLEALVGSLLRPMLKDWLDANLPGIVEEQVRKEVERIARSAG